MATRRSTRIANAVHKPQENMIFSPSVMGIITGAYVDMLEDDKSLEIIPLLTTCHLISKMVIPQLYRCTEIESESQYTSFLKKSSVRGVCHIKYLHTKGYHRSKEEKEAMTLFTSRVDNWLKKEKDPPRIRAQRIYVGAYDKIGMDIAHILCPIELFCDISSTNNFRHFKRKGFKSVETLTLGLGRKVLLDWTSKNYNFKDLTSLKTLNIFSTLGNLGPYRLWKDGLAALRVSTTAPRVVLELGDHPHVFCFEDADKAITDPISGVTWHRECPEGRPCVARDTCSDKERELRKAVRPETDV